MASNKRNSTGNDDLIKRLFNKVYTAIISEKIFCPPETAVYLAAYACQAKYGPAVAFRNPLPPVKDLLPKSTLDNHNLTLRDWEDRISKWHLKLQDISFMDAIVEYLDIAQDVELYGAAIFEVETRSHGRKCISLDAVGLNIYDSKRSPPTKRYFWSDITSFKATENTIEIELAHESKRPMKFTVHNQQTGKLLEALFVGSKELYSRRKKDDVSSKYARRSESNSSLRMRPHKLSVEELLELERQITELELELPRRATDYEFAFWQVKDQLRQARGIETKLSLNVPSTEETRQLQHRVANIRVFLEQDFFKESEPKNRPHRYRGNFVIRIGGNLGSRSIDYSSDIDSEFEKNNASVLAPEIKATKRPDNVKNETPQETPNLIPQPPAQLSSDPTITPSLGRSSPSETGDQGYVEHPYNGNNRKLDDPSISTMPSLPRLPQNLDLIRPPTSESPPKPVVYDPSAYPKLPENYLNTLIPPDRLSRSSPGYPSARGNEEVNLPTPVISPWKHVLRTSDQEPSSYYSKGRIHGQIIESEEFQTSYRPPLQPKPKVAPRGIVDPRMVTPEYYADAVGPSGSSIDPKFSSLKGIQSGYAKKRIDLFEAL